jgi:hypothetical protein
MYVVDPQQQQTLIAEMHQLRRDNRTWEVYYHHPSTNVMWKSFFPIAGKKGKGPKLLRTEPVADQLNQRLDNCLIENNRGNALGLGIELSAAPEHWKQIMDIISQYYKKYCRRNLSLFLKTLGIEEFREHFSKIDFDPVEHGLTENHFADLARRSKKLRFKRFWFF